MQERVKDEHETSYQIRKDEPRQQNSTLRLEVALEVFIKEGFPEKPQNMHLQGMNRNADAETRDARPAKPETSKPRQNG